MFFTTEEPQKVSSWWEIRKHDTKLINMPVLSELQSIAHSFQILPYVSIWIIPSVEWVVTGRKTWVRHPASPGISFQNLRGTHCVDWKCIGESLKLTPRNRILLETLLVAQLVKKLPVSLIVFSLVFLSLIQNEAQKLWNSLMCNLLVLLYGPINHAWGCNWANKSIYTNTCEIKMVKLICQF